MHSTFHPLYIQFFAHFNGDEDYFECHEVLEEYWKDIAPTDKEHVLVGLIQVATALYHYRRGNVRGATKHIQSAARIIQQNENDTLLELIQTKQLLDDIAQTEQRLTQQQPFQSFKIHITNEQLAQLVQQAIWKLPKQDAHFLLHKHTLRDRSQIIEQRKQAIQARAQKKEAKH